MATEEELLEQKRNLEERKLGLRKYRAEFRRMWSGIGYTTYRINSGVGSSIDTEENRSLQNELKAKSAGLKKDYQTTPRLIPRLIFEYDDEVFRIRRQLDKMANQELSPGHSPEPEAGIVKQPHARPQELSRGWSRGR